MNRRLLVLALGMFALGTDSFVVAGVLPQIAHGFDVSIGAAGQLVTVYAIALAVLAPTIAALAATVPRKRLLIAGLLVFVAANLGTAVAPSFAVAIATRALAGLGAAMFAPTATSSATMIVPPEKRGFALSVVIAGMTASTALGAPTGAVIGGLGSWHWTMIFVAALAGAAAIGVASSLSEIPQPPPVSLRQRLAPLGDARVVLTLATTMLFLSGAFTIYTYFSVVFSETIRGDAVVLGALLVLWGGSGTLSNLLAGRLVDRVGSRRVLVVMISVAIVDFGVLPWTRLSLWTAVPAIALWGACGWGQTVPQQHRLVSIAPAHAPLLLGLNNTAAYLGMTTGGIVGAGTMHFFGARELGFVAAGLALSALAAAKLASRQIERRADS